MPALLVALVRVPVMPRSLRAKVSGLVAAVTRHPTTLNTLRSCPAKPGGP